MTAALTHSQQELQHVHGSFLLQEVHETKEEILLLPDLLQLQLQHLHNQRQTFSSPHYKTCFLNTKQRESKHVAQINSLTSGDDEDKWTETEE